MENVFYIYVWYRNDNKKPFYVGKGKDNRFKSLHNRNRYFISTLNKYGGYVEKIIENLSEDQALVMEEQIIKDYKTKYKITNIQIGGNKGNSGIKMSKESKEKISKKSKEQWQDPIKRQRLIEARIKGHSTKEARENMSKSHKGVIITQEWKNNIIKGMDKPCVKEKMSKAKTKYKNIKVLDLEGNVLLIFDNTKLAAFWLEEKLKIKINISSLIGAISGKNKTSYGYRWSAEKI